MSRVLLIFILSCASTIVFAQLPYWVMQTPVDENANYYYRITKAEGQTYEKAYIKAFSMCLLESSWKFGVAVNTSNDAAAIERDISNSINVQNTQMKIPINKVCEYSEPIRTKVGIRIYILWQVANSAATPPNFKTFNKCK